MLSVCVGSISWCCFVVMLFRRFSHVSLFRGLPVFCCPASGPVFRQCSCIRQCSVSVPVFRRCSVFRCSVFWCSWFYSMPCPMVNLIKVSHTDKSGQDFIMRASCFCESFLLNNKRVLNLLSTRLFLKPSLYKLFPICIGKTFHRPQLNPFYKSLCLLPFFSPLIKKVEKANSFFSLLYLSLTINVHYVTVYILIWHGFI